MAALVSSLKFTMLEASPGVLSKLIVGSVNHLSQSVAAMLSPYR